MIEKIFKYYLYDIILLLYILETDTHFKIDLNCFHQYFYIFIY